MHLSAKSHCHSFNIHGVKEGRGGKAQQTRKGTVYIRSCKYTESIWNLATLELFYGTRKSEQISNTRREVLAIDICDGCLCQLVSVEEISFEYLSCSLNLFQMRYSACLCLI